MLQIHCTTVNDLYNLHICKKIPFWIFVEMHAGYNLTLILN